jgi:hypothetical protein
MDRARFVSVAIETGLGYAISGRRQEQRARIQELEGSRIGVWASALKAR